MQDVRDMGVLQEKAKRTDTRLQDHDARIAQNEKGLITLQVEIKASRYILMTAIALSTLTLGIVQFVLSQ